MNKLHFNFDPDTKTAFLTYAGGKTFLEAPIKAMVRELWKMQCEHDGIEPTAPFVVFSDDNPIAPLYQQAMSVYFNYR